MTLDEAYELELVPPFEVTNSCSAPSTPEPTPVEMHWTPTPEMFGDPIEYYAGTAYRNVQRVVSDLQLADALTVTPEPAVMVTCSPAA